MYFVVYRSPIETVEVLMLMLIRCLVVLCTGLSIVPLRGVAQEPPTHLPHVSVLSLSKPENHVHPHAHVLKLISDVLEAGKKPDVELIWLAKAFGSTDAPHAAYLQAAQTFLKEKRSADAHLLVEQAWLAALADIDRVAVAEHEREKAQVIREKARIAHIDHFLACGDVYAELKENSRALTAYRKAQEGLTILQSLHVKAFDKENLQTKKQAEALQKKIDALRASKAPR
jgi:hypothetical protein